VANLRPRLTFLIQSIFRSQIECPHCHSKNSIVIAQKYISIKIKYCSNCFLYFTSPIYKPLLSNNFYDSCYEGQGSTTSLPNKEELDKLLESNFVESDKCFTERIAAIKSISKANSSLLEIGSSWGYFLWQAKNQGFKVKGIEIGGKHRLFAKQNLEVNMVDDIDKLEINSFDIIYTSHVLEHFTDISKIFSKIHSVLTEKGKLIIEVPNFDYEKYGNKILSIIGAVHPLGYTANFFTANLPNYGFKLIGYYDSWESFPSEIINSSLNDSVILLAEKLE
jgi:2-polyprenyl-3-methyl-5-hydroxy-6-metoxy-1,4-benzoquinol methylase